MKIIGMLGGGQLGRMAVRAGHVLGLRFVVYDPSRNSTAARVADACFREPYEDEAALQRFSDQVDVVSFEFENVPMEAVRFLEARRPLRPGSEALRVCQDREAERRFLAAGGFPVAPHQILRDAAGLPAALAEVGAPAVLKTARGGYDGKGQVKIDGPELDAAAVWGALGHPEVAILERWVQHEGEISVICVRGLDGARRSYPPFENHHEDHILHTTVFPARIPAAQAAQAQELAEDIAEALGIVGLLTVEMFRLPGGGLLVNELAPRPHNSGHVTIEAAMSSQFEQHLRAVVGWPLGPVRPRSAGVMVNLLGQLWSRGEPNWRPLLEDPQLKLHLYDKGEARVGRKMGHFTMIGEDVEALSERARAHILGLSEQSSG